jgi:ATP-dependent RNA helicase RhlE
MQRNTSRHFGGRSSFGRRPQRSGKGIFGKKIDVSRYINTNIAQEAAPAPYTPAHAFADFAVHEKLKASVRAKGYETPTPIQDKTIPEILKGKDIVGIANTGTGKTAAFLIPLIHKTLLNKNERVLIVVPTHELAAQINDEFKGFAKNLQLYSVCAVGGAPIHRQMSELRRFNNFVIGTPGRIKDLINRGALNLSRFGTVVLDEADRMLDMGFIGDMRMIISKLPAQRHTLFFSATISSDVEHLIYEFLNDPVRVSVKTGDTSKNVLQDVIRVTGGASKNDLLYTLLKQEEFEKVLIFGKTKHGVQRLADSLAQRGFSSVAIHGNKNPSQRQRALNDFKTNRTRILVATDVAARGLDIPDVSHVINFDLPKTHEDYIHRIGRTGRGDKKGKALTFVE